MQTNYELYMDLKTFSNLARHIMINAGVLHLTLLPPVLDQVLELSSVLAQLDQVTSIGIS